MKKSGKLKICAGASAGGHMGQLLKLLEVSGNWPQPPSFYITTMEGLAGNLAERGTLYIIGECTRRVPLSALRVLIRSIRVAIKERPDVVVTTGSMPLAIFCLISKVLGAKVVWIDSVANVEQLSMSGRFVRHFADLFLTQWPELALKYKNVEYSGAIV